MAVIVIINGRRLSAFLIFSLFPVWVCGQQDSAFLPLAEPMFQPRHAWYVSSALQVGFHRLDVDTDNSLDLSSVGQGMYLAIGRPIVPILSIEAALDFWFTDEEDDDPIDHALLHDFHFSGISLGIYALLHLPNVQGPYAKVGRHCWSASVYDTLDIWNGEGCSNLFGGGVYFGESGRGYFMEVSRTRYERIDSWFLTAGFRF